MTEKKVKLTWQHQLNNLANAICMPITALELLDFAWAINRKRKSKGKGACHPIAIPLQYENCQAPAYASQLVEEYGTLSLCDGSFFFVEDNRIVRRGNIWVSSVQIGWAENLLTAGQYCIDGTRHSEQKLKELPRPWKVAAKSRTWESKMRYLFGALLGAYTPGSSYTQAATTSTKPKAPASKPKRGKPRTRAEQFRHIFGI